MKKYVVTAFLMSTLVSLAAGAQEQAATPSGAAGTQGQAVPPSGETGAQCAARMTGLLNTDLAYTDAYFHLDAAWDVRLIYSTALGMVADLLSPGSHHLGSTNVSQFAQADFASRISQAQKQVAEDLRVENPSDAQERVFRLNAVLLRSLQEAWQQHVPIIAEILSANASAQAELTGLPAEMQSKIDVYNAYIAQIEPQLTTLENSYRTQFAGFRERCQEFFDFSEEEN